MNYSSICLGHLVRTPNTATSVAVRWLALSNSGYTAPPVRTANEHGWFKITVTNYTPTPIPPPQPRVSAIKVIAAVIAALFAALLGLLVLLVIGAETGLVELMIGMVCAIIPVPIYVMLLLWIDRYESEPLWM